MSDRELALFCPDGAAWLGELTAALDGLAYGWVMLERADSVAAALADRNVVGAVVRLGSDAARGWAVVDALREAPAVASPLVVLVDDNDIAQLGPRRDLFDDFCCEPVRMEELLVRLSLTDSATGDGVADDEVVSYGPLRINGVTYEAVLDGEPLDLTYMQYRLLRHLAAQPGRVFTREAILNQVWGYEYFGGARTVDVHIRRLRAKLGEEHASLIQTVRSVGYRFGRSRWR